MNKEETKSQERLHSYQTTNVEATNCLSDPSNIISKH